MGHAEGAVRRRELALGLSLANITSVIGVPSTVPRLTEPEYLAPERLDLDTALKPNVL